MTDDMEATGENLEAKTPAPAAVPESSPEAAPQKRHAGRPKGSRNLRKHPLSAKLAPKPTKAAARAKARAKAAMASGEAVAIVVPQGKRSILPRNNSTSAAQVENPEVSRLQTKVFVYHGQPGQSVYLAGEFNQWNPQVDQLLDPFGCGEYKGEVKLLPGRYQYKLVVNGAWILDPENEIQVSNGLGTSNNLMVIL